MASLRGHKSSEPYQELDEIRGAELNNVINSAVRNHMSSDFGLDRSLELTSVAVVPDDTFTVSQAINLLGFGRFQVKLSLFTGLCWMADSMEMTILSILSPTLHCDWGISRYQQALTTTVVFLGMMLSSTFWNNLSDRYVTLYAEFLPAEQRAKCVILLDCFWALGACFEVALALVVMPHLGWRWLLVLSTIPLFLFFIITPWLPESASYDMMMGRTDKALTTLERIARENGKPMPSGRLVIDRVYPSSRGKLVDLLNKDMYKTSVLLWLVWMASAFCYYGVVLMTTELFDTSADQCGDQVAEERIQERQCLINCQLSRSDYMDLLWTTLAEFPGIFSTIYIIEKIGRKKTMAFQLVMFAVVVCFLGRACRLSRFVLTLSLFLARGLIAGVFQAAYVYTPELYPTYLRSTGVSACSAMARLGAMVTPYIAQILLRWSVPTAMGTYAITALCAAFAIIALPAEIRKR
ncbi:synaptic vesicle 2-related protein isoform X2 [Phymastichus coffea]|uniref:synaptic vesicle 2-related protein isoform X2 n=1 Tax=Phymastichus coffea TaxID=108790 RepID=UPI00273B1BC5|nr:synaptic vesicle 2-related protein isoform X2 [Phymastichus coffea]